MAYILGLFVIITINSVADSEFVQDYMTESCNQVLSPRVSGRFETTTSLTYKDNTNCETTISVADGKRILLAMRRFELEEPLGGVCPDYLSVYDGSSTASPPIYDRKCGSETEELTFNTSANHVTFKFVSDDSAVFRGFEVEYTQFSEVPCVSGEFQCASDICIDEGNRCDDVNQCGDNSDESQCTEEEVETLLSGWTIDEIIGCTFGLLVFIVICIIVAVKLYLRYKKKQTKGEDLTISTLYEYPITDKYKKYNVGIQGRRKPHNNFFNDISMTPLANKSDYN